MNYRGSCHCGQVAFEVEGELKGALSCNCSICRRKGALMWFVPRDALTLGSDEADLATYTFHKHVIHHRFCARCGIHTFGEGTDPRSGQRVAAVNLRCLEGIDLDAVPVQHFDGRSL
jgi:hypothetical protein